MSHAFISYVREDSGQVEHLAGKLRSAGAKLWLDRDDLEPGVYWKKAISSAVRSGAYFIACFSAASKGRAKTYMNEELTLAVEELRLRPHDVQWFIPVLFDGGELPDLPIRPGQTLQDIQAVSIGDSNGLNRLMKALGLEDTQAVRERLLLDLLASRFTKEQAHAFQELKTHTRLSDNAFEGILAYLAQSPTTTRPARAKEVLALDNLGRSNEGRFIETCLSDKDASLRRAAFSRGVGRKHLAPGAVAKFLGDRDEMLRGAALEALTLSSQTSPQIYKRIVQIACDEHDRLAIPAMEKLLRVDVPHLWQKLGRANSVAVARVIENDQRFWNTFIAVAAKAPVPNFLAPLLVELTASRDRALQKAAADRLVEAERAERLIYENLKGDSVEKAIASAYILGRRADTSARAKSALAFAARFSPNPELALVAATALHRLNGGSTRSFLEKGPVRELFKTVYSVRERTVSIINERGLDAREAAKLVKLATGYDADIYVERDGVVVQATSIMGLLMLGAMQGTSLTIGASGPEALEALDGIEQLAADRFGAYR